jgi:uncharacterized membrane protein (UPF0127 family)
LKSSVFALGFLLASLSVGCAEAQKETRKETENAPVANPITPTPSESKDGTNLSRIFQLKDLKKTTVKTKNTELKLWVMDSTEKRREGMMFIESRDIKDDEGMIFIFKEVQLIGERSGFWMKNTPLPLDIVYIDKNFKVINVGAGKPYNEDSVTPRADYLYVVEVKGGLALKYGLTPGSVINIPKELQAVD